MPEFRKLPDSAYGSGGLVAFLAPGISLLLLGGFWLSFSIVGSKTEHSIWVGALQVLGLIMGPFLMLMGFIGLGQGLSFYRAKRSWLEAALRAGTAVVGRAVLDNDTLEARSQGEPGMYWYLELDPIAEQAATRPGAASVVVAVTESQYRRYEGRSSVTIYYSRADPFVFLLEDEV